MQVALKPLRIMRRSAITEAAFPTSLKPDTPITGSVSIANPAETPQDAKVEIIPQWTDKIFTATKNIPAGETASFLFPEEFIDETGAPAELLMPETDAILTINEYMPSTVTEPTDTVEVTIKVEWLYVKYGPLLLWQWLALGGATLLLMVAFTRK